MSVSQHDVVVGTGPAPLESNISTEHPFTDVVNVNMPTSYNDTIWALVESKLPNTARVDLVSISGRWVSSGSNQSCRIGITAVGSEATIDNVSMEKSGKTVFSSTLYGQPEDFELVVDDLYTRQLKPNSASLPIPKLLCEYSKESKLVLMVHVKVRGVRKHYLNLKAK